jgi:diadenosine tetraphosphate (Ap4A) HIT family hydrolase
MSMVSSVDCIDEGTDWKITIPQTALSSHSLLIDRKGEENSKELFAMMQKVARFWEKQGICNYLAYKSSLDNGWEMVPTSGNKTSLWDRTRGLAQQLQVVFHLAFGRYSLSEKERSCVFKASKDLTSDQAFKTQESVQSATVDAFCKKEVIDSQLIWEGKHMRVLFNYAPLGKEGLHYLIVPRAHREKLTELTQEEFDEGHEFASALIKNYPEHICYRYHKTGSLAGQTVPHFHEHVVFVKPEHDFRGKLSVFYRMVTPPNPLHPHELKNRVKTLKTQLIAPE